jgi:Transferrin receptor-like dimerisation domain
VTLLFLSLAFQLLRVRLIGLEEGNDADDLWIAVFPGLAESIDAKDYRNAEHWVLIIEGVLEKAMKSLE